MVKTAGRRYVQGRPKVAHQRRRSPYQIPVAQCICQLRRYERQVDLHQEEGDDPTRHTEVREETPRSGPVEGTGFERRRQFRKPFSSDERFVASCSFGVIFLDDA